MVQSEALQLTTIPQTQLTGVVLASQSLIFKARWRYICDVRMQLESEKISQMLK